MCADGVRTVGGKVVGKAGPGAPHLAALRASVRRMAVVQSPVSSQCADGAEGNVALVAGVEDGLGWVEV